MCRGRKSNYSKKERRHPNPYQEGDMIDYEQNKPEEKGDRHVEGRNRKENGLDQRKRDGEFVQKAKKVDKVLSPDNTLREIEGGMPQMEVTHNTSHEPIFTDDQLM